jgi:hypothetical protein
LRHRQPAGDHDNTLRVSHRWHPTITTSKPVGVDLVLLVGFQLIVTISNLFLCSLLLALGELMLPSSIGDASP